MNIVTHLHPDSGTCGPRGRSRLLIAALGASLAAAGLLAPQSATADSAWDTVVLPILENKCNQCHNEDRVRGRLRMDTYELLMQGGASGETVIPGDVEGSEFLVRIHLPLDDDDHMPPADQEQLTEAEIAILQWWIAQGASETKTVAELEPDDAINQALAAFAEQPDPVAGVMHDEPVEEEFRLPQPDDETREKIAAAATELGEIGAMLMPIAQDSGGLQFTALNAIETLEDSHLDLLAPVAEWVVTVDLARTKISDDGVAALAGMVNLERLHLENTGITDAALAHLRDLPRLSYLNLYATGITDEGLRQLAGLKSLQAIYLWQTEVTDDGVDAFASGIPGLVAHLGLDDEGNERVVVSAAGQLVSVPPETLDQLRQSVALTAEAARAAAEAAEAASKAADEARAAAASAAEKLAELEGVVVD